MSGYEEPFSDQVPVEKDVGAESKETLERSAEGGS